MADLPASSLPSAAGACHRRLGVSSAWRLLGRAIGTPTHADAFPSGALTRRRCLSGSVQWQCIRKGSEERPTVKSPAGAEPLRIHR